MRRSVLALLAVAAALGAGWVEAIPAQASPPTSTAEQKSSVPAKPALPATLGATKEARAVVARPEVPATRFVASLKAPAAPATGLSSNATRRGAGIPLIGGPARYDARKGAVLGGTPRRR
jgi:hypothetical protein